MAQIKVEILIPLFYNDKTPIEDEILTEVHDEIIGVFHDGLSREQSIIEGKWMHPQKKVYVKDVNKSVYSVCDDTLENRQACKSLKEFILTKTKQDSIFMTITLTELV